MPGADFDHDEETRAMSPSLWKSPSPTRRHNNHSRMLSGGRSTTPSLDGPAGTRYLHSEYAHLKKQEKVKRMPDGTPTLCPNLEDGRRLPGYTGYIPNVQAESIHGKSYGNLTEQRRELCRTAQAPEKQWTSCNRSDYVDLFDAGRAGMQEDEKAVEDSEAYIRNLPRHWREIPGFDIVKAVNIACPTGAKLGYKWADPKSVPKMSVQECKLLLREKISQRVPTGGHFLRKGFVLFSVGTKYVTFDKFCTALQVLGLFSVFTYETVADLYADIDRDEDGLIQLVEFIEAFLEESDAELDKLFDRRRQPVLV